MRFFRLLMTILPAFLAVAVGAATEPPEPYGALPSERQLAWHEMEYIGFLHFTVNTFTDREWGDGAESPSVFNPTQLDARQWARVARDAGMKGLIITAKHHDGFCLWPSAYTEHSVKNSPWKNGKGDILRELSDACREYGIKFGVYLSPWDRNHAEYARPGYVEYYRKQMHELLTQYGDIFEVWFDGANGGTGYYGGANEERRIDRKTYYQWPEVHKMVRKLQPMAVMFSDGGPDVRWVGNERGIASETNWATLNGADFYPGLGGKNELLGTGQRHGTHWLPAEVDTSIRPGWFYHASEDHRVKTLDHLLDIFYSSVGRGGTLLLNVPPDRRGLIHENDAARLKELRKVLNLTFDKDLAEGTPVMASNVRGGDRRFAASHLTDGDRNTYWATDDDVRTPEVVIDFGKPTLFNRVRLQEHIRLGQRVEAFTLDARVNGTWKRIGEGTSIGPRRILRTAGVKADQLRVRITKSPVCPVLSTVEVYLAPASVSMRPAEVAFMGEQTVTLKSDFPGAEIRYTLDGAEPTAKSARYERPITLKETATIKASAFVAGMGSYPIAESRYECLTAENLIAPVRPKGELKAGLRYDYYEGGWQTLDQMERERHPRRRGETAGFDLSVSGREEHFGLRFFGFVEAPADGVYEFFAESSDGSGVSVAGRQIIDNNHIQPMTERSGMIGLKKGLHPIEVRYFKAAGAKGLKVSWKGPGRPKQEIPSAALRHLPE